MRRGRPACILVRMADGFDIHLDEERARRLRKAAEAAGVDARVFAMQVLDQALEAEWAEDFRRVADYERTGASIDDGEWMQGLQEAVRARFRS